LSRLPIRLRLTLAFALVMALLLAGMGVFVDVRVGDALLASVDQTLRSQSSEAVAHASRGADLGDRDVGGSSTLAQELDAHGRVLRSDRIGLVALLSAADARRVAAGATVLRSITLTTPDGDWRVLGVPSSPHGKAVVVARSLEPREESLDHLFDELLVAGPLALLLASLAGYGLAAAALRPVEAMRRRAAAVSASSPGRLPVPRSHDEISRLATTINEMLERLEAAFEHERRFVADASHELRTPLALLRAEIEVTLRRQRTAGELEATLRSAAEETERLSRLAEDLLLIARSDRGGLPIRRQLVTAGDIFGTVASRFSGGADRLADRGIVVEGGEVLFEADPERLVQAIGNLVDNALGHGAHSIALSAVERGGLVELHVADDGDGFPQAFLPRAFDRFSRADEARSRGGTGLGLSIVELIAAAHGGHARAANRPAGGADVWIEIPRGAPLQEALDRF
jgi:two-component system, OmpR family, sensor kinase